MGPDGDLEAARSRLDAAGLLVEAAPGEAPGGFWLRGNTFAHRELIKQHGGQWSRERQAWRLASPEVVTRLAAVVPAGITVSRGLAEEPTASPLAVAGWGTKHYHGHRERLRQRFATATPDALADYELLELLLFFSVRRRDTKPLAKDMLARFGGLGGVLAIDPARYVECGDLMPFTEAAGAERRADRDEDVFFTQTLLKAVHETMRRVLKEEIAARPLIGSWTALIDYLRIAMQHETAEHFRILFLDRKNILIRDEVQSRGTVDHTPLYPREVVKRALELAASAIIMVHNHPSGDPTPSPADLEMTRQVIAALQQVNVAVHDHIIVGKNKHTSFKTQRLI